jgi:hypothetical protein
MTQPVADTLKTAHGRKSPLPNGGDLIFICPMYLLLVLLPNFVFSDGSTGWHLVTGQYILDHLRIPHEDLISYTFPHKPWIPSEWLFDLVAAALVKLGGLKLLALATASAIASLFVFIYQDARRSGCHFVAVLIIALIGLLTSSVHWLARPHLFTFFGVYIFARYLEALHRNEVSAKHVNLVLGLAMIVWVNAHPAFLLGLGMVAIYLASEAITVAVLPPGEKRELAGKRAVTLLAGLAITVAVSLVNPRGLAVYPYLATYWRQGAVLGQFQEWQSPTFHGQLHATGLELLFLAFVIGLATSRRKPWLGQLLLVLAFAHLALSAMRNEPLFVIVSLPVIAGLFVDNNLFSLTGTDTADSPRWLERLQTPWQGAARAFDKMEFNCTMHLIPIALVAVLAFSCIAAGSIPGVHALVSARFDPKTKPTATLDYIANNRLPWDRGFNLDNWGGYIRYMTGQRVFIDDRLDFYGEDFYRRYVQTLTVKPGWQGFLDEYRVGWVLLPKNIALVDSLKQTPGWHLQAEDPAAYLFVR